MEKWKIRKMDKAKMEKKAGEFWCLSVSGDHSYWAPPYWNITKLTLELNYLIAKIVN